MASSLLSKIDSSLYIKAGKVGKEKAIGKIVHLFLVTTFWLYFKFDKKSDANGCFWCYITKTIAI
ncbi:hypothetical protein D8T65_09235 [Vibrio vulnificus]|nr:hypothetical protein OA19_14230 [Vibrio vulnificus]KHF85747.1 hypothetical protein OA15_11315 [Vibrio vulnificus]KHF89835.1 hypothetical protein OA16_14010 [Vibrio vulnificus]KHF94609.1 hypothetical protein OA14_13930 [Vibrio vulnificus]PAO38358.1 hypothetical protein BTT97_00230 [Vibrio vulnificus]